MTTLITVVSQDLFEAVEKIHEKYAAGKYAHKELRSAELCKWLRENYQVELKDFQGYRVSC